MICMICTILLCSSTEWHDRRDHDCLLAAYGLVGGMVVAKTQLKLDAFYLLDWPLWISTKGIASVDLLHLRQSLKRRCSKQANMEQICMVEEELF